MSLYLGDNLISGKIITTDKSERIGQIILSTIPLTDAGLHLLNGALIQGDGIYADFVDYIADLYADNPTANYFCTEEQWQQSVTDYGVCGKFVYDSVNNTVRLPKITGFVESTIDPTTLGDLTQAGLPNITADWNSAQYDGGWGTPNGAVYGIKNNSPEYNSGSAGMRAYFDASRSNPIYGNSSTVQPQSIKVLYYIVLATTTKTDIQVDIDEIATDLNGKADIDLANTLPASTFIDKVSSWTMPDYTTGVTRTWNTVYQAQDNVIVTWYVSGGGQNGQYAELYVGTTSNPDIKIDGGGNDQAGYYEGGWIIVPKGYYYKATGAGNYTRTLIEYPLKGAN